MSRQYPSSIQPTAAERGQQPTLASLRTAPSRPRRLAVLFFCALGLTCVLSLALTGAAPLTAQGPADPWAAAGAMGTVRNSHSATLLPDGRVLVAGGWDGANTLASAELYDPRTQTWAPTGALSVTRAYHTAILLPKGQVLVAGGWDSAGAALASAELYDPGTGSWTPVTEMSSARAGHTATLLPNGKVLVAGGDSGAARASAELYDPATNSWTPAGGMGVSRSWHTATLLPKGQVLIAGGWDRSHQPLASAELYDPAANTWKPAAALAVARLDHTATLLPDGGVLVVGGYNGDYLASAELYDPGANVWSSAGNLSSARAYHAAILLRDGTVLVAGGANGSRPSASAELYDPHKKTWTPAGALPAAYESYLAILLNDGRILITGRPGSSDPTGNGGVPTPPGGAQSRPRPPSTPQPPMQPTPTSKAFNVAGEMAPNLAGKMVAMVQATTASGNFATSAEPARLFGVYEVSFTRNKPTDPNYNPYAIITASVIFRPQLAPSEAKTVLAFYDGADPANPATREIWRARVYVNRVGPWDWTPPSGFTAVGSTTFTAVEDTTSGLRGMLRVAADSATSAKRWYTDDGRTFLPMADTAYRLFFEADPSVFQSLPATCPRRSVTGTNTYDDFVGQYAADVVARGINVLRVESLGTWAYANRSTTHLSIASVAANDDCTTDLSLFWSTVITGSSADLWDDSPSIDQLHNGNLIVYPNLVSFQRIDRKLKLLLDNFPTLYVQMLLVPESLDNWFSIYEPFRRQLWQAMVARWAAFPNVFWSISNDTTYHATLQPWVPDLAKDIGCYFEGDGDQNGYCPSGAAARDPWHARHPMSFGSARNYKDYFITLTPAAPWHTYITAYSGADLSAQEMDGARLLPEEPDHPVNPPTPFHYAQENKPTFNTEDRYEGEWKTYGTKEVENPDYYFRRLFWSYLLSGGGAAYGADPTWQALERYSTATYTATDIFGATHIYTLTGLSSMQYVPGILDQARVDLALFQPSDILQPTPVSDWTEFNRAQVAARIPKEILAYIPNTANPIPGFTTDDASFNARRAAAVATTRSSVSVNMAAFTDTTYAVTWYNPTTGVSLPVASIPGTTTVVLTAPGGLTGDAVLHISSRCTSPNVCEPMDQTIPTHFYTDTTWVFTSTAGFEAGDDGSAELHHDSSQRIFGANAWRCDRPTAPGSGFPGCWVRYTFPNQAPNVASADFYFRRNSISPFTGVYFMVVHDENTLQIEDGVAVGVWLGGGGELHLDSDHVSDVIPPVPGVAPEPNRWYHLAVHLTSVAGHGVDVTITRDGVPVIPPTRLAMAQTNVFFRRVIAHAAWWEPTTDLVAGSTPSYWWDELTVDPPALTDLRGLYRTVFRQGLGYYADNKATWFDYAGGYNDTNLLHVGANNDIKALLRFDVSTLPANAIVDEAILQVYYTGRSNGNSLTLGAHRVLTDWIDSQANRVQRKTGVNWQVAGMGSGSDYTATAEATANITGAGGAWVELNVTNAAQAWVSNAAGNYGLVLLQEAASGYVIYDFCSELGWSPCAAAQAPRLTLRYHLAPPPPVKATFQQGTGGYTGANATYFDASGGYNYTSLLHVGANNDTKALLRFDVTSIPANATVDEATLRLYYTGRSNSNSLTLGAHGVLAEWIDSQANRVQRKTGVNWQVAGMGSGSDYTAAAAGTTDLAGGGGAWIELDVTDLAQTWVTNPANNNGLVLLQEAAGGYVTYDFCSELGWSPCSAAQAPKLTIWYH